MSIAVENVIVSRRRYYSCELGRFVSRDPLGFVDGMNLYSGYFAMHGGIDPSGKMVGALPYVIPVTAELLLPEVVASSAAATTGNMLPDQHDIDFALMGAAFATAAWLNNLFSDEEDEALSSSGTSSCPKCVTGDPNNNDDDKKKKSKKKQKSKKDRTPKNNQAQNKQFDDATRGLSKAQKRQVHEIISKQNMNYHQIKEIANQVKNGFF